MSKLSVEEKRARLGLRKNKCIRRNQGFTAMKKILGVLLPVARKWSSQRCSTKIRLSHNQIYLRCHEDARKDNARKRRKKRKELFLAITILFQLYANNFKREMQFVVREGIELKGNGFCLTNSRGKPGDGVLFQSEFTGFIERRVVEIAAKNFKLPLIPDLLNIVMGFLFKKKYMVVSSTFERWLAEETCGAPETSYIVPLYQLVCNIGKISHRTRKRQRLGISPLYPPHKNYPNKRYLVGGAPHAHITSSSR